jgi:nitrite reductase (NADH) small subunit
VAGRQVAIFRVDDELYALSNYDPFSEAFVLSRGIVGSAGDRLKVASPVYKQSFDLATGACLEDPSVTVPVFSARVVAGRVQVGCP